MDEEKLMYIDRDNVYVSVGIPTSMSAASESHKKEIKAAFKKGIFSNFASFKNFVKEFEKEHAMFDVPLNYIRVASLDSDFSILENVLTINVINNKTKYTYIVNQSNNDWNVLTSAGFRSLETGKMMLLEYDKIKVIIDALPWYIIKGD